MSALVCANCNGAGAVPAGGGEPPEQVDDGYVRCPDCTRSCGACGNGLIFVDGQWIDPNEIGNNPELCLLNERSDERGYGPHQVRKP